MRYLMILLCLFSFAMAEGAGPFSGKTKVYEDKANAWSFTLPEEFAQQGEGQHVFWTGPVIEGGGASVHMNITDFPGVGWEQLYNINVQTLQGKKTEFTDLRPLKLPKWKGVFYKEVGAKKAPGDIHRWYAEIYAGNGPGGQARIYSVVLGGSYAAFTNGTLPPVYDALIKSLSVK